MNEQIQELLKQAGVGDNWNKADWYSMSPEMVEKFADMIVQECMACSTWVGKMNTNSVEPIHTAHAINQRIKQHFGVAE
jgi:hypothetical protein